MTIQDLIELIKNTLNDFDGHYYYIDLVDDQPLKLFTLVDLGYIRQEKFRFYKKNKGLQDVHLSIALKKEHSDNLNLLTDQFNSYLLKLNENTTQQILDFIINQSIDLKEELDDDSNTALMKYFLDQFLHFTGAKMIQIDPSLITFSDSLTLYFKNKTIVIPGEIYYTSSSAIINKLHRIRESAANNFSKYLMAHISINNFDTAKFLVDVDAIYFKPVLEFLNTKQYPKKELAKKVLFIFYEYRHISFNTESFIRHITGSTQENLVNIPIIKDDLDVDNATIRNWIDAFSSYLNIQKF